MHHAFLSHCCTMNHIWRIKPMVYTLSNPGCKSRNRPGIVESPYFCPDEATTCKALNLRDGVSAFWKCRGDLDMCGVCAWLFCWPWSMHMPKYVLCCAGGCIPYLCRPRFEPRAALENCYWISSCKQSLTVWNAYFWLLLVFLHGKKAKSSWQHCWAVTASCEVLILATLTVKHVAASLNQVIFGYIIIV